MHILSQSLVFSLGKRVVVGISQRKWAHWVMIHVSACMESRDLTLHTHTHKHTCIYAHAHTQSWVTKTSHAEAQD